MASPFQLKRVMMMMMMMMMMVMTTIAVLVLVFLLLLLLLVGVAVVVAVAVALSSLFSTCHVPSMTWDYSLVHVLGGGVFAQQQSKVSVDTDVALKCDNNPGCHCYLQGGHPETRMNFAQ